MVVDGRMGGGKFLEASHTPETEHCVFSSPERQVGILRTIVQPAARWNTAYPCNAPSITYAIKGNIPHRVIWPICRHSAGSTSILPAITTGKHRRTLGPDQFRPLRTRAHNSAAAA